MEKLFDTNINELDTTKEKISFVKKSMYSPMVLENPEVKEKYYFLASVSKDFLISISGDYMELYIYKNLEKKKKKLLKTIEIQEQENCKYKMTVLPCNDTFINDWDNIKKQILNIKKDCEAFTNGNKF